MFTTSFIESKLDSLTLKLRELPEDAPMGSNEPCWLEIHVIKPDNKAMRLLKKEYPFSKAYNIARGVCSSTPNFIPKGTIVCRFRNSKEDKLYDYAIISENF